VAGKKVATVSRKSSSAKFVLKGTSSARTNVKIVMHLRDGRTRSETRKLNPCG
jgi:hypothetical protein